MKREINKEFWTYYYKERSIFNPFRYILGKDIITMFPENKQKKGYTNAFDFIASNINLDVKDIEIYEKKLSNSTK